MVEPSKPTIKVERSSQTEPIIIVEPSSKQEPEILVETSSKPTIMVIGTLGQGKSTVLNRICGETFC